MKISGPESNSSPLSYRSYTTEREPILYILTVTDITQLKDQLCYLGILPSFSLNIPITSFFKQIKKK